MCFPRSFDDLMDETDEFLRLLTLSWRSRHGTDGDAARDDDFFLGHVVSSWCKWLYHGTN